MSSVIANVLNSRTIRLTDGVPKRLLDNGAAACLCRCCKKIHKTTFIIREYTSPYCTYHGCPTDVVAVKISEFLADPTAVVSQSRSDSSCWLLCQRLHGISPVPLRSCIQDAIKRGYSMTLYLRRARILRESNSSETLTTMPMSQVYTILSLLSGLSFHFQGRSYECVHSSLLSSTEAVHCHDGRLSSYRGAFLSNTWSIHS